MCLPCLTFASTISTLGFGTIAYGYRSCPAAWTTATAVLRHLGRTDEPAAVGSERRCTSGDRYSTLRPYIASAPSATLATNASERPLQGGLTVYFTLKVLDHIHRLDTYIG